jgi:hypothetical protein
MKKKLVVSMGLGCVEMHPLVSYILFVDDSLILMKADMTNATSLQQVLDTFMYGGMEQMGWVCQL